jgi:2-C-methyl-D-erythritol 2,4-cyclodiphosphate synthase
MTGTGQSCRIGQGVDVHTFAGAGGGGGRPLILGGVAIPDGPPLEGHSDGDVVLHAITDALLGAAALGDLGALFGTDDPAHAGAASSAFVAEAVRRLGEPSLLPHASWAVGNLDCTVVAQRPRLGPYRDVIAANVAALLGVDAGSVSVKATTSDGLGFTGRGEGIACLAVVLLVPAT